VAIVVGLAVLEERLGREDAGGVDQQVDVGMRPTTTTLPPSVSTPRAVCRPMPLVPPTTSSFLPSNLRVMRCLALPSVGGADADLGRCLEQRLGHRALDLLQERLLAAATDVGGGRSVLGSALQRDVEMGHGNPRTGTVEGRFIALDRATG
jgi:hypothetical protein